MTNEEQLINKTLVFLKETGIEVHFRQITEECFLPGLLIENGKIIVDREKLKYPGDILHEAAHIAVVEPAARKNLQGCDIGKRKDNAAEEMAAIAWSYAACVFLEIDPAFVFHAEGYHGDGQTIIDNFGQGHYFGVPMLQLYGMSAEPRNADALGIKAYPAMQHWMRT